MKRIIHDVLPDKDIETTASVIKKGGIVIYPTETVYGLGADAYNIEAVKKLSEIKHRNSHKPISIAVCSLNMINDVAHLDAPSSQFIRRFLPGPVTVILRKKEHIPDILTGGSNLVGIRFPDHPLTIKLIESAGYPITSTSANISGRPAPSRVEDIEEEIISCVDHIINGGDCYCGEPSTVVDLVNRKILRSGALSEDVIQVLEELE